MSTPTLRLSLLSDNFAICRLNKDETIPDWATAGEFCSITRTTDELSIVCTQAQIPEGVQCDTDWRGLRVEGTLAFSLTGVLNSLTAPLAKAGISIFAISTFDTDYLLVKADNFENALTVLSAHGHQINQ